MKIWYQGKFVKPSQVKISPFAYSLQRAVVVQDSVCAFATTKGPAIFRLKEHVKRFFDSAQLINMKLPFSQTQMANEMKKAVQSSNLAACYLRPVAYYAQPTTDILPVSDQVDLAIGLFSFHQKPKALRIKISSLLKVSSKCLPTQAKVSAHYLSSAMAKKEALLAGYDEGLFFDSVGYLAEAPTANIFLVKNNNIYTPKLDNILAGITRDSVIQIARALKYQVIEKNLCLQDLVSADEVFYTSSAINVVPVIQIEQHQFQVGPVTKQLQEKFEAVVSGQETAYKKWLAYCG